MSKQSTASTAQPVTGFLRLRQLIPAILPVSASTLWRMVKRGDFPAPTKLSTRVTAWNREEVLRWVAETSGQLTNQKHHHHLSPVPGNLIIGESSCCK